MAADGLGGPRQPAIPVAYALAQSSGRLLNTELSAAGGLAFQAFVSFTASLLYVPSILMRWWLEHDGLLICVIGTDDAVAPV
jgi:hypothetical protein